MQFDKTAVQGGPKRDQRCFLQPHVGHNRFRVADNPLGTLQRLGR